MKKLGSIFILTFLAATVSFAQKGKGSKRTYPPGTIAVCEQILDNKIGTVYAGGPAVLTYVSDVHILTLNVAKFAGKAKTDVKIFVNGVEHSTSFNFPNGPSKPDPKELVLSGMKGKKVQIKLFNRSVSNSFRYSMTVKGRVSELVPKSSENGNILGGTKKTINLRPGCAKQTKVTLNRKSGKARASVKVFYATDAGYVEIISMRATFEKGDTQKVLTSPHNARLRIEVKNLSATDTFGYSLSANSMH